MEAWKHGNTRALACGVFHCLLFACCTFLSLVTNKQMSQRISFLHSPPRNPCLSCRYTIIDSGRKSMALHMHAGSWTQCTVLYFIVDWCGSDALCFGVTQVEVAFIAFKFGSRFARIGSIALPRIDFLTLLFSFSHEKQNARPVIHPSSLFLADASLLVSARNFAQHMLAFATAVAMVCIQAFIKPM
jgi:hypothetical protein